ncbi:MAG: O-antigen ligase family protein [Firmicutes bacterium]|nr:O-antigen ligase family protein [Alicyclobacillaceae bacterium]MCL6498096.1 O-antigen ligase family protein [Bacillota bacterium]
MRRWLEGIWRLVLAVFVSTSLYQGYLTLPGLHGHSLFSILQRLLVFLVPVAVLIVWWRGRWRTGTLALSALVLWIGWLGERYWTASPHTYYAFYYLWTQVGGVLVVLSLWLLARRPGWFKATLAVALLAFYAASVAVAFWEVRTAHHLAQSRSWGPPPSHVPTAFFFDPNNLGVALAILLPWVAALPVWRPDPWLKVVVGIGVALGLVVLYETGSRGGELMALIEAGIAIALLPAPHRRRWAVGAGIAIAALVLLVVALNRLPPQHLPFALVKLRDLAHLMGEGTGPNGGPGSVRIRLALLAGGIRAVLHHPLGLGPRGAERYFTYWVHHPAPFNTYGVVDAHNPWLEAAMDGGWPGLGLWVLFYVRVLVHAAELGQGRDPFVRYAYWASWPALWGFLLGGLSPASVFLGFNVLWVWLGAVVAAAALSAQLRQQASRIRYQLRHFG